MDRDDQILDLMFDHLRSKFVILLSGHLDVDNRPKPLIFELQQPNGGWSSIQVNFFFAP